MQQFALFAIFVKRTQMKLYLSLLLLIISFVVRSQNLLKNGDFSIIQDSFYSHWTLRYGDNLYQMGNENHLKLISDQDYVIAHQYISIPDVDGGFYALSGEISTTDAQGRGYMRLDFFDQDTNLINRNFLWRTAPMGTTEKQSYSIYGYAIPKVKLIRVDLGLSGKGTVQFDNIAVEKVKPKASDEPEVSWSAWIDTLMHYTSSQSIRQDSVDWHLLNQSAEQVKPIIANESMALAWGRYVLAEINDGHSFFITQEEVQAWYGNAVEETNEEDTVSIEIEATIQPFDTATGKFYKPNIGYLTVPHIGSGNFETLQAFGHEIRKRIQELVEQGAERWIVDLRGNTGGNMWPMIAGLAPLFEDEQTLGSFVRIEDQSNWYVKGNASYIDSAIQLELEETFGVDLLVDQPKVAVLVGPRTSSSGEFTFMSFQGRPRTRSFGEETGGYTTGNANFSLPNGAMLFLATSIGADRTGKRYGHAMKPDVLVKDDAESDKDEVIEAAIRWLKE